MYAFLGVGVVASNKMLRPQGQFGGSFKALQAIPKGANMTFLEGQSGEVDTDGCNALYF